MSASSTIARNEGLYLKNIQRKIRVNFVRQISICQYDIFIPTTKSTHFSFSAKTKLLATNSTESSSFVTVPSYLLHKVRYSSRSNIQQCLHRTEVAGYIMLLQRANPILYYYFTLFYP
jgi:hypothetical protein